MAHNKATQELKKQKPEILLNQMKDLNDIFEKIDDKLMKLELNEELERINRSVRAENLIEKDDDESIVKTTVNITNYQNESILSVHKRAKVIENLKKYLNVIDYFNGSNINVNEFITEMKIVLNKISMEERGLFVLLVLKQKIIGEAKILLDGIHINNVQELFETLRVLFNDTDELINARMKRNVCIQRNDSVLMYSLKFLHAQIDIIKAVLNNPFLIPSKKKSRLLDEKTSALDAYISGLKHDIKILLLLKAFKPGTLFDAMDMALNIENDQKSNSMYCKS